MRTNDECGGSAFPHETADEFHWGMTLRDWFAGQALANLVREAPDQHNNEQIAGRCYAIANAMLAEREKPQ